MVCVDFSLIGSDPKVSHLLAGIAMSVFLLLAGIAKSLAVDEKGL